MVVSDRGKMILFILVDWFHFKPLSDGLRQIVLSERDDTLAHDRTTSESALPIDDAHLQFS